MEIRKLLTATSLIALSISTANAALVGRLAATEGGTDYQAYYDTEADLTWLADANYAGVYMGWNAAMAWAEDLDVAGVTGWRLPETSRFDPDCDYHQTSFNTNPNCTGEMGNLYYNVLGNTAGTITNTGPFENLTQYNNDGSHRYLYMYTSEEVQDGSALPELWYPEAIAFYITSGLQSAESKGGAPRTWAVHSGDVSAVPIPPAVWLFGSGLIGLIGFSRRKKS